MTWISIAAASVAPGIALLMYFYLKDRYVTEPVHVVLKVFMIGVLLVFPIMIVQRGMYLWLSPPEWATAFLLSGGVEEFMKWFMIFYYIYKHKEFDEPYDGIVYAVAVSLGFATFENVIYAWSYELEPQMLIYRALFPISGHALFGVVMGYYIGKAKFDPQRPSSYYLMLSLFLPALWHGIFDYLVVVSKSYWIRLMVPFMGVLWLRGLRKVSMANDRSPYRSFWREDDPPSSSPPH